MKTLLENSNFAVSYMVSEITRICREMKPRAPGTEGEREAGKHMAYELETDCGCKDVKIERFSEHPASFYSYFYFSATFDCLCAAFFFFQPWLSMLFGLIAYAIFISHFVLYKKPLDPLFPEREIIVENNRNEDDVRTAHRQFFRWKKC